MNNNSSKDIDKSLQPTRGGALGFHTADANNAGGYSAATDSMLSTANSNARQRRPGEGQGEPQDDVSRNVRPKLEHSSSQQPMPQQQQRAQISLEGVQNLLSAIAPNASFSSTSLNGPQNEQIPPPLPQQGYDQGAMNLQYQLLVQALGQTVGQSSQGSLQQPLASLGSLFSHNGSAPNMQPNQPRLDQRGTMSQLNIPMMPGSSASPHTDSSQLVQQLLNVLLTQNQEQQRVQESQRKQEEERRRQQEQQRQHQLLLSQLQTIVSLMSNSGNQTFGPTSNQPSGMPQINAALTEELSSIIPSRVNVRRNYSSSQSAPSLNLPGSDSNSQQQSWLNAMLQNSALLQALNGTALASEPDTTMSGVAAASVNDTYVVSNESSSEGQSSSMLTLALPTDVDQLSEYQILVRKQLQVFEARREDVDSSTQGRKKQVFLGQVGLRCRHCANIPLRQRGKGAVYYPAKLSGVYQAAQNMASSHLSESCHLIPDKTKQRLLELRGRRDTASGGKRYWAEGCQQIGMIESEDGIRLAIPKKVDQL